MNKIIKAELVFTNSGKPLRNGGVEVDSSGTILNVYSEQDLMHRRVDSEYKGFLVPGFVNSHCHLELSFAAARIERNSGIDGFIARLEYLKSTIPPQHKAEAIDHALEAMNDEGIVAVGDICNTSLTVKAKSDSNIKFRNFVEVYGLDDSVAADKFRKALTLKSLFDNSSIVPHSAYSLSQSLFTLIEKNTGDDDILSIHHQESEGENTYFKTGDGPLADRFRNWGLTIPDFIPTGKNPAESLLQLADFSKNKMLFVHNTFSTYSDVEFIVNHYHNPSFCLCPSSNIFIENTLPPLPMFLNQKVNLCLGTDSLASTDRLSILGEMIILQKAFPQVEAATLIAMATINGAKALGFDDSLGSFQRGKTPGGVIISEVDIENMRFTDFSFAERIF